MTSLMDGGKEVFFPINISDLLLTKEEINPTML